MKYTRVVIIYNPKSTGSGKQLADELRRDLAERLPSLPVELRATERAGHAEAITYEVAVSSPRPLIVSSSGDGGYHEVINGALRAAHEGHRPTTGLLPAGNANDHFRNLDGGDLARKIIAGEEQTIDVLVLQGVSDGKPIRIYAHSYIGFGVTPWVGSELNKTELTPLRELTTVAQALFAAEPVRLRTGGRLRWYQNVICSNVTHMSKYLKVSHRSSIEDGRFEVTMLRRRGKLRLILHLLRAALVGVHETMPTERLTLELPDRTLVQADGEIMTLDAGTTVDISIERRVLRCVI